MRAALVLTLATWLAACGGERSMPAAETAPAPAAAVDVAEVPMVGKIYAEAVRKARAEINADNAHKRLTEIERQIEAEVTSAR